VISALQPNVKQIAFLAKRRIDYVKGGTPLNDPCTGFFGQINALREHMGVLAVKCRVFPCSVSLVALYEIIHAEFRFNFDFQLKGFKPPSSDGYWL
jgi:hypothetical protein